MPATTATTRRQPELTSSQAAILAALTHRPDATARALANASGIGYSTAGKALAALEKRGLVTRTGGGHRDGRRAPDTWRTSTPRSARTTSRPTTTRPTTTRPTTSRPTTTRPTTTRPTTTRSARGASTPRTAAGAVSTSSGRPVAAGRPAPTPPAGASAGTRRSRPASAAVGAAPRRLPRGHLPGVVAAHLDDHPGQVFTPYQVGRATGHSPGACAKVMRALAARGRIHHVGDTPRRYQAAGGRALGDRAVGDESASPPPAEPAARRSGVRRAHRARRT